MTKEFLAELGIEGETAEAVLNEAQREIEDIRKEGEELRQSLESELYDTRRDCAVDSELRRYGARNSKAVRALLDMDGVSFDGETVKGLIEQLERLKEENGFLFGGTDAPRVVAPSGGERGNGFGFKFTGVRPKNNQQ